MVANAKEKSSLWEKGRYDGLRVPAPETAVNPSDILT